MFKIRYDSATDIGTTRKTNQDTVLVKKNEQGLLFLGVFDGMGGLAHGELASQIVAKTLNVLIDEVYTSLEVVKERGSVDIQSINHYILKYSRDKNLGMIGSTLCLMVLDLATEEYVIFNVGDSAVDYYDSVKRGYFNLTNKHTALEDAKKQGMSTEGLTRNTLSNCLGVYDDLKVDLHLGKLECGVYIISSDGVWDYNNASVVESMLAAKTYQPALYLINEAMELGSTDNVSAIVLEVGE